MRMVDDGALFASVIRRDFFRSTSATAPEFLRKLCRVLGRALEISNATKSVRSEKSSTVRSRTGCLSLSILQPLEYLGLDPHLSKLPYYHRQHGWDDHATVKFGKQCIQGAQNVRLMIPHLLTEAAGQGEASSSPECQYHGGQRYDTSLLKHVQLLS